MKFLHFSKDKNPPLIKNDIAGSRHSYLLLLIILSFIQFIHVLDFVIVMPLGSLLMRDLEIGPGEFGSLVSSYNFAASIAGLVGAFSLDRFDRKSALLWTCAGFGICTWLCAIARSEDALIAARFATGSFGGILQALIFTIVGDAFREDKRGAATGTVMSAFSFASIVGIPVGLMLAQAHTWRAPFLLIAALSTLTIPMVIYGLPRMTHHLKGKPFKKTFLLDTFFMFNNQKSLYAITLVVSLMFAGFSVIPFMSAYLVENVGLSESDVTFVFLGGGIATLATSRLAGILADRFGKLEVFTWLAIISILPSLALTHLPSVPLMIALSVTTTFTVMVSARAVPALALITSIVSSERRGRFLSFTSSVQQAASGLAAMLAGNLLTQGPEGQLEHYNWAGYIAAAATFTAILAARQLAKTAETNTKILKKTEQS